MNISLVNDVLGEYEVIEGTPRITIRSANALKYRGFYACTVRLTFMRHNSRDVYGVEPVIAKSAPVQVDDRTGVDGKTHIYTVWMDSLSPSTGFLDQNLWGAFVVPAIHIDISLDRDIWALIMRSPWSPAKVSLPTNTLSISHDSARATAIVTAPPEGGVSAALMNSGSGYKSVSLVVRRVVGLMLSDEMLGETTSGMLPCTWRSVSRSFDLMLLTGHSISLADFTSVLAGLGAPVSPSRAGLDTYFVLADGPGVGYKLVLDGDKGLMRHDIDEFAFQLSW